MSPGKIQQCSLPQGLTRLHSKCQVRFQFHMGANWERFYFQVQFLVGFRFLWFVGVRASFFCWLLAVSSFFVGCQQEVILNSLKSFIVSCHVVFPNMSTYFLKANEGETLERWVLQSYIIMCM